MPAIPTVSITVADQGASAAQSVPQSQVQLKIGCAVGAGVVVNQPFATSSPTALQKQLVGGPLCEAGGLVCQAGNIVVAIACPIVSIGTATAVTHTGTGASVMSVTLDATNGAWDDYYGSVRVYAAGTFGTNGVVLQVSLDAGRNYGTPIAMGTSLTLYLGTGTLTTFVAGGTGVQVAFTAATAVVGDTYTFSTKAPQWNGAGVAAALAAFQASQYGVAGVGSIHIVGDAMHGGSSTTDVVTIHTQLAAGTAIYEYNRAIVELRDALVPVAWGGSGETEATWIAALQSAASGLVAQPRIDADGGYYNTPSCFANAAGGLPAYRRNAAWAHAVRRTQIPLQRRAGRVKDGPYSSIAVNPQVDPTDGFIYHDERTTPGLNIARVGSLMTWPKKGAGFFQCQEPLLCAPGSQFVELVIGNVLDIACDIGYAAGVEVVSDDLVCQPSGALDPQALNVLQGTVQQALNEGMLQVGFASGVTATVNKTANVQSTGVIPMTIAVLPNAYVNSVSETIGLTNGGA